MKNFLKVEKMLPKQRMITDTVYGHIPYSGLEEKFLQSKIVNRLLFVSQNALAYFAFPSITTKRYIHSMGTMHVVSYMFKHAILNSTERISSQFLKQARREIKRLIKHYELDIDLRTLQIDDKALLTFSAGRCAKEQTTYLILLQALRLGGLLHDVGHLPFSHQTEYAMKKLYEEVKKTQNPNKEQKRFLQFYEHYTQHGETVLHESIGYAYLDMLFNVEVSSQSRTSTELVKLYYLLVKNILDEVESSEFGYGVLHEFISSTIDADRIDYINRDLLASGYVSSSSDLLRVAREAVLIRYNNSYRLSYFTSSLYDVEHVLETRFNLYKKVFSTHHISRLDTLLEKVITFLSQKYLASPPKEKKLYQTIAMMWKVFDRRDRSKQLDLISQLDENWLISLFKTEYFKIKYQQVLSYEERYYLAAFEDILFGKHIFVSHWGNLSEFYTMLGFSKEERFRFREKFGALSDAQKRALEESLGRVLSAYNHSDAFYTYSIVSLSVGIEKKFLLYDGEKAIRIDEISTVRKRLKTSLSNSVPFFLFSNQKKLPETLKQALKEVVLKLFS
jgi:HD superfamily phosphohydrolase